MRALFLALAAGLALAGPLAPLGAGLGAPGLTGAAAAQETAAASAAWDADAARVQQLLADTETPTATLERERAALVDWRARFDAARGVNSDRIATLNAQLEALGPAPADGASEAAELAARRTGINAQLAELEAPRIAATESYSLADTLIHEIDTALRERQTAAILELWPTPANPGNWPEAAEALAGAGRAVYGEVSRNLGSEFRRANLQSNLPVMLLYLVVAAVLVLRGRHIMERLERRARAQASRRGARAWEHVISVGQVAIPVIGMVALAQAIRLSGMAGPRMLPLVEVLPWAGFAIFGARWLAGRLFPKDDGDAGFFELPRERRIEARAYVVSFGLLIAAALFVRRLVLAAEPVAAAVILLPFVALGGALLFRFGRLLRLQAGSAAAAGEEPLFRNRIVGYAGLACILIGVAAPVMALVGYVPAAVALVFPAAMTLGLIGFLIFLQDLMAETYATVMGGDEAARDGLIPVLMGFVIAAFALPVFALIWGARIADLQEFWLRIGQGFTFAGIRISPGIFLTLAVVFLIGYAVTRLFQGALRSTILPKTRIDEGGQKAIIAGVGYVGVAIAALIATTTAGINLSSLAILAGALSVGVGFGLQTIVQNFVSGIILLLERPVSEGDWIEVGGVQGRVRAISVRSTRIETFDRNHVIVPNASLVTGVVTNVTRFNLAGRLLVPVSVSGVNDGRKVQKVLEEVAAVPPMVVLNPPPSVGLISIDGGNYTFEMRLILRDVNFKGNVQNEILHLIKERFAEEGIAFGVMGAAKTIMADGDGRAYVLPGAVFAPDGAPGDASAPDAPPAPDGPAPDPAGGPTRIA